MEFVVHTAPLRYALYIKLMSFLTVNIANTHLIWPLVIIEDDGSQLPSFSRSWRSKKPRGITASGLHGGSQLNRGFWRKTSLELHPKPLETRMPIGFAGFVGPTA